MILKSNSGNIFEIPDERNLSIMDSCGIMVHDKDGNTHCIPVDEYVAIETMRIALAVEKQNELIADLIETLKERR
jgi:hypothetical protein